jgi:hypothetical protein
MVAGDIALNAGVPQIRNVELDSTSINNYPKIGVSLGSAKSHSKVKFLA